METPTLLVMAALNLLAAGFFLFTAKEVSRRSFSPSIRLAGIAFIVSWFMLAVMTGTDALRLIVASTAHPDLALYTTLARVKILATAVMIAGFGYYVAYLWTGNQRTGIPIALLAVSHGLFFFYMLELRAPVSIASGAWGSALVFANPPLLGPSLVAFVYYFAPPILLAVAYLSLIFHYEDGRQRLRAAVTGSVVIFYHAIGVLLYSPQADLNDPINPIAATLIAASGVFAWILHRQPTHPRTGRSGPGTWTPDEPSPPEVHPLRHLEPACKKES